MGRSWCWSCHVLSNPGAGCNPEGKTNLGGQGCNLGGGAVTPGVGLSQINKLHLCKPLIRAIDSSNLKDDYSTAQRVTFRYYVGRKAMFDSDFKQGLFVFVSRVLKMRGSGRRQQLWHLISM